MRRLIAGIVLAVVFVQPAHAQVSRVYTPPNVSPCKTVTTNAQGAAGADITVDSTAGGVSVMAASTTRCGALIKNAGTAAMRCAATTLTVSSTVGELIDAGETLVLGLEGQQAWKCIRTTGTSTSASVSEATL